MNQDSPVKPFDPNYWGVPDWRAKARPKVVSWAWEFLRRNWEYRNFWLQEVQPLFDPDTGRLRADQAAETVRRFERLGDGHPGLHGVRWEAEIHLPPEAEQRFGIRSFPVDPRQDQSIPHFQLSAQRFYGGRPFAVMKALFGDGFRGAHAKLEEHEIAVVLDLDQPIAGQLRRTAETFRKCQEAWGYKPRNRRSRLNKYWTYLRVLDADDCCAGDAEIVQILFPLEDDGAQSVRNTRRQAHQLRDGGYRALAAYKS